MISSGFDLENHRAIFGQTSSGKTYFFRKEIYRRTEKRVVFYNAQRERGFGREVTHWDPKLLQRPGSKVNLVGPRPSASEGNRIKARDILARVVDDLFSIGDKVAKDRTGLVVFACDEADDIAPKMSKDDPLTIVGTNGNRYGVKGVALTQRPAILSQTFLANSPVHVMFKIGSQDYGYFREYKVPDHVQRWVNDPPPGGDPEASTHRFATRANDYYRLYEPA